MRIKFFYLGIIIFSLISCSSAKYLTQFDEPEPELVEQHWLDYDVPLVEVERPSKAKERYGEQKLISTEEDNYSFAFEDDMVRISWIVHPTRLSFFMNNKTDHSIRIIWDEGAYVDENNLSHKIMHSGIRYVDKDKPQSPSVVVRRGTFSEEIIPINKIHYAGLNGWMEEPLLPFWLDGHPLITNDFSPDEFFDLDMLAIIIFQSQAKEETVLRKGNEVVGKTIQVLLPIQIEGVTNDYIFTFKVSGFEEKIDVKKD